MTVFIIPPSSPVLAPFVECIYDFDESTSAVGTILPEGKWDLVFNLGSPGKLVSDERSFEYKNVVVTGLHEKAVGVRPTSGIRVIGVKFKAPGLFPFLRIPLHRISGRFENAELLFDRNDLRDTHDRLFESNSCVDRARVVEEFLLRSIRQSIDPRLSTAIATIHARNGAIGVSDLASITNLSERRLCAIFADQVGIAPKKFVRITRFTSVMRYLRRGHNSLSLTQLGYDHQFTDQSHFIRDFKSITGLSPRSWLRQHKTSEKYNFQYSREHILQQ